MAEKNFKVLGLDVVGSANITSNIVFTDPNSAIDFSSYLVDVDVATGKLRIGQANLATEQYVTDAIGNISIPDAYITSIGQNSPFLTVGQGALDVSLGNGLEANLANNTLQLKLDGNGGFDYNEGRLRVKAWNGIQVNDNGVAVETNYIANAIAGTSLVYNGQTGKINVDTDTIATKAYADSIAAGLDIKKAVHLATSENVAIGNVLYAGNTFDNHVLADGDRILVKDQTNSYENGIYVVSLSGASRATDADSWAELNKGSFVFVESGTHAGHGFVVTTATTGEAFGQQGSSIEFTQFSDAGSFITSVAPGSPLTVNNGELGIQLSSGLTNNNGYVEVSLSPRLEFNMLDNSIDINPVETASFLSGSGLTASNNKITVDTGYVSNAIAGSGLINSNGMLTVSTGYVSNAIAGQGLINNQGFLDVNVGTHLYIDGAGTVTVDGYGLFQSWTDPNGGLVLNGPSGIGIDYSVASNNLAGAGLTASNGQITVNYSTIASNLDGSGLTAEQGTLTVNTIYVAQMIQGTGLQYNANNGTLGVALGNNLEIDFVTGGVTLTPNVTVSEDLIVSGNLTVNGTTTTLNTTTLEVEDNLIVLNKNVTGTPLTNAGIEIERGNLTNASLYFDEESDQWKAHNGTSIITLGSSYITSIGQASPFLDVTAGELNLSVGNGLENNPVDNHLQVALSAGGGLAFDAPGGTIKVDIDAVGDLLETQLMVAPTGKQKVTYTSGVGFLTDAPSLYGPKTMYDGTDSNTSNGSSVINIVGRSTVNTQTWSNVGTIPVAADSFDAYITMVDSGNSLTRTSRVTGSIGSFTVEYTEYGIVEVGQSPILNADIMVEYDLGADAYVVKAKGQGVVVADIKYTTVA